MALERLETPPATQRLIWPLSIYIHIHTRTPVHTTVLSGWSRMGRKGNHQRPQAAKSRILVFFSSRSRHSRPLRVGCGWEGRSGGLMLLHTSGNGG